MLIPVIVILLALVACAFDLRTRRIPNALTFGAALAGLIFHRVMSGTGRSAARGRRMVRRPVLLFMPFFALRGMGGGDVKLLAALGAWLGPQETLWVAVYTGIAGGALGCCRGRITRVPVDGHAQRVAGYLATGRRSASSPCLV